MSNRKVHLQHVRSKMAGDEERYGLFVKETPKLPNAEQLNDGEIAVNYLEGVESLSIKNSTDGIVRFETSAALDEVSEVVAAAFADFETRMDDMSSASDETVSAINARLNEMENVSSGIRSDLNEMEHVAASAFNDLEEKKLDKTEAEGLYQPAGEYGDSISFEDGFMNLMSGGTIISSTEIEIPDIELDDALDETSHNAIENAVVAQSISRIDLVTSAALNDLNTRKQDTLTFDDAPTANSNNPVKSGGVKTALDGKQDTLTFDDAPTEDSTNPVTSGGVFDAISDKQDTLVSGTNIKTVNDTSLLGSGNIDADDVVHGKIDEGVFKIGHWMLDDRTGEETYLTIMGDPGVTPSEEKIYVDVTTNKVYRWHNNAYVELSATDISGKQDTLVSGTNIKTVNDTSLLGSGNIDADDVVHGRLEADGFKIGRWRTVDSEDAYMTIYGEPAVTPDEDKLYVDVTRNKIYRYHNGYVELCVTNISGKQDLLTFDNAPTANSSNPVTSGGVYQAIADNELTISAALNDLNQRKIDKDESDLIYVTKAELNALIARVEALEAINGITAP